MKEFHGKPGKLIAAPAAVPPAGAWFLVILTGIVLYLCWVMLAPFVPAVTWAAALSVVLNPLRSRLIRRLPKTAAAVIMLTLVVAVIVASLYLLSQRLIQEILNGRQFLRDLLQPGIGQRLIESEPWIGSAVRWLQSQLDLESIADEAYTAAARGLAPAFARSAVGLSRSILSLLFFFFFVRDQEILIEAVRRLLPLTESETERLFDRTASTMQATIIGRMGIGAIQGMIGGILFLIAGIPAPLFWAIVMGVLSMLPVVGAFVVWIPASIVLLVSGHWLRALVLAAGGVGLIHPVDNIVYPLLVGPRLGLHPLVLLVAFLGGVIAFGPPGLILGPLIVTIATVLMEIWHARTVTR